jgi:GGDEF domain-containing protein
MTTGTQLSAEKHKQRLSTAQMIRLMRLEMEGALRHAYPISCMVIGLDRFDEPKEIALRRTLMPAIFKELKAVTFSHDVRGLGVFTERYVLALFPHVAPDKLATLAQEMLARGKALSVPDPDCPSTVTLSVGVSHNLHKGKTSFESLVEDAEQGMSVARSRGGDRSVQWREVETEIDALRAQIEQQLEELEENKASWFGEQDGAQEDWGRNLIQKALELFRAEADQSAGVLRLEQAIIALITDEVRRWRESSGVKAMVEGQRQIELLERRILKLTESLGMTEAELQRVAAMKNIDLGLSSIYRNVQGLAGEDVNAEQKRAMLRDIFESNVALREELKAVHA